MCFISRSLLTHCDDFVMSQANFRFSLIRQLVFLCFVKLAGSHRDRVILISWELNWRIMKREDVKVIKTQRGKETRDEITPELNFEEEYCIDSWMHRTLGRGPKKFSLKRGHYIKRKKPGVPYLTYLSLRGFMQFLVGYGQPQPTLFQPAVAMGLLPCDGISYNFICILTWFG